MSDELISIIIPIYNSVRYLDVCISSIVKQTHTNLQIILIDDGSYDGSSEICDEWVKKDERIEVFHFSNAGSVRARKRGLEHAKGQYIGFVDSDDYIEPDMYESLLNRLIEQNADFVHCGLWHEYSGISREELEFDEDVICPKDDPYGCIQKYTNVFMDKEQGYITNSLVTKLFRAELIKKTFGKLNDAQQLGEDGLNLMRCIFEAKCFVLYRRCFYHYVEHEDSLAFANNTDNLSKYIGLYDEYRSLFLEYGVYDRAKVALENMLKILHLAYFERVSGIYIERYKLDSIEDFLGKRVAIYGAGQMGKNWYTQLSRYEQCKIVAWVDKNKEKQREIPWFDIQSPDVLLKCNADYVLIAMLDKNVADVVKEQLVEKGIDENVIIWRKPHNILDTEIEN